MSISAEFKHQFNRARKDASPLQALGLHVYVEKDVLQSVLDPINEAITNAETAQYLPDPNAIPLSRQVQELRQMCLEAHASNTTEDRLLSQHRTELINALQGIIESIEDAEKSHSTHISIDYDDFFKMTERTQEIRSAARILKQFLKNDPAADALYTIAENIKTAQANLWEATAQQNHHTAEA